jgi:hypothetical protein
MNHIEHGLCAEPPSDRRSNRLVRKRRIRIINLNSLSAPSSGRSIRQKLRIAALFQRNKPKDRLFNAPTNSQKPMVLQQSRFLIPKSFSNILPFFLGENDAVELPVDNVVLYPSALIHSP